MLIIRHSPERVVSQDYPLYNYLMLLIIHHSVQSESSVRTLLNHLGEAVGDVQGCIDESFNAVHQACFSAGIQFGAGAVHALVPADICKVVHLCLKLRFLLFDCDHPLQLRRLCFFRRTHIIAIHGDLVPSMFS